jgi:hypothetical protein
MPTARKTPAKPPVPRARRKPAAPGAQSGAHDEESFGFTAAPLPHPPARRVAQQPAHRYRVGDTLRMLPGGYSSARPAAGCRVVALLPYEGHGALLYRVRSDNEAFERVVPEADLSRT